MHAPEPTPVYAVACRHDLPPGSRHTQLYADAARRRRLFTVAHECAEAETVTDTLGRARRVTWGG